MNATTTNFQAADVVSGRPVVEGKTLARRKGIVLGSFDDNPATVVVWWFTMDVDGAADACTLMYTSELTGAGDIFDNFRARKSEKLARLLDGYGRGRSVRNSLASHARRMRSIGAL